MKPRFLKVMLVKATLVRAAALKLLFFQLLYFALQVFMKLFQSPQDLPRHSIHNLLQHGMVQLNFKEEF
jgi:hypothetical protein